MRAVNVSPHDGGRMVPTDPTTHRFMSDGRTMHISQTVGGLHKELGSQFIIGFHSHSGYIYSIEFHLLLFLSHHR